MKSKKVKITKENNPSPEKKRLKKKRTALGELIRWAEYNYFGFDENASKVIDKAKKLLEREKDDIINAVENNTIIRRVYDKKYTERLTGEQYYLRKFNNKK